MPANPNAFSISILVKSHLPAKPRRLHRIVALGQKSTRSQISHPLNDILEGVHAQAPEFTNTNHPNGLEIEAASIEPLG